MEEAYKEPSSPPLPSVPSPPLLSPLPLLPPDSIIQTRIFGETAQRPGIADTVSVYRIEWRGARLDKHRQWGKGRRGAELNI